MVSSKSLPNILIVDSNESTRQLLSARLRQLDFNLIEATEARAALSTLNCQYIDLVLVDAHLVDLSIAEFCQSLRLLPHCKEVPILLLSHGDDLVSIEHAYNAGVTDFINERDNLDLAIQRIRYTLRNSQFTRDLSSKQRQLEQVHRVAKLGYWRLGISNRDFYLSDEAKAIFGLDANQFDNTFVGYLDLIHISDREVVKATINNSLYTSSAFNLDHRIINTTGSKHYVHTQGEVVLDEAGKPSSIVGTVQDITERKRAEATIEHLALYDSLTDLCNRRLFQNRLAHSMALAHRNEKLLAVCFFDLDNFKSINDNLGHPVGDDLLRNVARRLRNTMRHGDIIARISGDEFALAIEGLKTVDELEMIVDKLRRRLAEPYKIHGHTIYATASIGLALYPLDNADRDAMMRYADAAMYRAKELGGNSYCYYSHDMSDKSRRRLDMEYKLRHALEKNQLRVFYQPQIDIRTGNIIGMEALLRWVHPKYGLLPPSKFISIAEDTGLIFSIGKWVLQTACRQIVEWRKQGSGNLHIAVNMSFRQIVQEDTVDYIAHILQLTHCNPHDLRIEINENALMQFKDGANDALAALKALGIQLAIDDFGSGHSSMNHLQKLPIDVLNIDRSFIMNIADREQDGATARAIIALAHNLGLQVIAEGVETATHVAFLHKHHCDEMQGNYFSPPVTATEAGELLVNNYAVHSVTH